MVFVGGRLAGWERPVPGCNVGSGPTGGRVPASVAPRALSCELNAKPKRRFGERQATPRGKIRMALRVPPGARHTGNGTVGRDWISVAGSLLLGRCLERLGRQSRDGQRRDLAGVRLAEDLVPLLLLLGGEQLQGLLVGLGEELVLARGAGVTARVGAHQLHPRLLVLGGHLRRLLLLLGGQA